MSNSLIAFAAVLTAVLPGAEQTAPRNDSIRQQDLKADLFFLAGDGFRGRLTASPENDLASAVHRVAIPADGPEADGHGRDVLPVFQPRDRDHRRRPTVWSFPETA